MTSVDEIGSAYQCIGAGSNCHTVDITVKGFTGGDSCEDENDYYAFSFVVDECVPSVLEETNYSAILSCDSEKLYFEYYTGCLDCICEMETYTYEYYSDFDDNSDDDLNGFIVHDNNNNNDQDYNAETDEEYQAPSDDSDTDIQMINQNQAHHDSTEILNENNKRKRNFSDFEPNLKRRKLQLTDDRLTQIVNEHFLEKTRQLKKQRTLIVVPLCILEQWFNEIDKKAPGEFNILKYHGNERRKLKLRDLLKYDVVITTYDIICFDYNRGNDEKYENTFFSHKMKGFFYRIVLDEAHIIKNCNSWKARACAVLGKNGCKMRWVLTGTPIQNGLCDLFSLGRFLRYPQFYHLSIFKNVFWIKGNKGQYRSRETRLKILSFLSVVMLRRLKSEVIDNIVSKTEEWIEVELDNDTRMLYDKYESDARSDLEYHIQCGNVQQHWNTILIQLMRLRQICSNPDIAMGIQGMCKYCGDEVDKPYKIMKCGHLFCAEHLEVIEGKCPMILCKVEFDEWSDDIIDLPNRRPYFSKRWRDFMELNHGIFTMELLNKKFGNDIAFIINTYLYENNNKIKDMNAYVIRRRITKAKGEYANINMNSGEWNEIYENVEWNKEFKDDKMNGYENNYIFPAPYEYTFIPTAKTKILIKKILMIRRDKPKDKILIYSQWTTMLNLIEFVLNKYDIGYYRYDGSLSYDTRVNIIKDFKEGFSDKNVLLISLKCGAVGLNLETANHVMFVDLWWNPAIEAQAIDRVHRIGQKKHVYVTRFVIKNSVQDRMLKIQDEKKECADFALNGAKLLSSANGMNIDIVRRLFGE
eukprot:365231_1